MTAIQKVTQDTFKDVVMTGDKPVLVDFWAEWCSPCLRMNPILEQLADDFADRAVIAKVNVDEERGLAAMYQIMSIPALMIFHGGEKVAEFTGTQSAANLEAELSRYL